MKIAWFLRGFVDGMLKFFMVPLSMKAGSLEKTHMRLYMEGVIFGIYGMVIMILIPLGMLMR